MRQTFFHELEEVEKQEKREEKERVELFLRGKTWSFRNYLPFFLISFIGVFAAMVIVYALYLFINVSKIGNVADVHMTKMMELALRSVQGKIYNNPGLGIKNWMVFSDKKNGFEVRYPENWKLDESPNHLFQIKKYNSQASINESLAAAAFIDRWGFGSDADLEAFVLTNEKIGSNMLSRKKINGNDIIKVEKIKDEHGLAYCVAYWKGKEGIYSFKAIHYNQKNQVTNEEFDKILSVLKIGN